MTGWRRAAGLRLAGRRDGFCRDCHLGNLGAVADAHGRVAVQIRILDQTIIGDPAHDLIRLDPSFATAARGSDLPGVTSAHMIEEMETGYEHALADEGSKVESGEPMPDAVRAIVRQALGRKWTHRRARSGGYLRVSRQARSWRPSTLATAATLRWMTSPTR
jgi:uncharacterized protein (DUF2252 family)